jgi:acyl CoA:acetate/3-ketoacid CoA transferase alpha subunit/acyl CoA:acetate/3-ketoacid CoA transferase beta subunit
LATKVISLRQAVEAFITPGCHVAIGGFSLCRNAMAVSHEIIRRKIGNLRVSSVNPSYSVDILIGAGLVQRVESGCVNMERLGLPKNFCRAVELGTIKSEDYEHGAMTFRYLAGALGLPFIPTKSLLGSDILTYSTTAEKKYATMASPFSGEKVILLPPCRPEVAVIHVTRADEQGNCQIDGTTFADEFIAKAADHVVLITEQLISNGDIRKNPKATVIPAFRVDAIVHCPWGAYPTAVPGCYDYDYEALKSYQQAASSPESFQAYLDRFVYGVKDFEEYLEVAGTPKTYRRLAIDPRLGYSSYVTDLIGGAKKVGEKAPGEYNLKELMIIAAARELKDGEIIVAGTGLPMAATTIAKLSHAPNCNYIVETGIGDVKPKHSAVSVADLRLLGAAEPAFVSDTLEGLGYVVHRGLADVGFLGGAQIDMYGNLNATLLGPHEKPAKRFPGSGGANVIASCAKRVLVIMQQQKRRFVEKVDYITSPGFLTGGNARYEAGLTGGGPDKVITDLAVLGFDLDSKRMKLLSVHPGVTVQQVCDATGFELILPENVEVTPPPTEKELQILRENVSPVYFADTGAPAKAKAAKAGGGDM